MSTGFSEITAAASLLRAILDDAPRPAPAPDASAAPAPAQAAAGTHQALIERELAAACRRAGATWGLVADTDGLPLVAVGAGGADEAAPVSAAVLGAAALRTQQVLGAAGEPQVSVRLDGGERLVVRRFAVADRWFNLLLRLPPGAAEPAGLEQAVGRLAWAIGLEPSEAEQVT